MPAGEALRAYIGVPLSVDDQVVGALCAADSERRRWSDDDVRGLTELCASVERLLGSATTGGMPGHRRTTPRVSGVLRLDRDLRVELAEGDVGPRPGCELVGRHVSELIGPAAWPRVGSAYEAALAGATCTYGHVGPTDGRRWTIALEPLWGSSGRVSGLVVRVRPTASEPGGSPAAMAFAEPDRASGRGRSDGSIHDLDSTLLSVLEEGVVVFDAEERIIAANAAARRMLDLADRPLEQLDDWRREVAVRDDAGHLLDRRERGIAQVLATARPVLGQVLTIELLARRLVVRLNAVPLPGADGHPAGVVASFTDITQLRAAEEVARRRAERDPLTGLPNRVAIARDLDAALLQSRATGRSMAALVVDLDGFKAVNDAYGHAHGDRYLQLVAARMASALPDRAVLGRVGGDEFVVVLGPDDAAVAMDVAERLEAVLGARLEVAGAVHAPAASIGVATSTGDPPDDDPLAHADLAMYAAKAAGGRQARSFTRAMEEDARELRSVGADLRAAIAGGQLRLHYQPIVTAVGGRVVALEALVRWEHPDRGLLAPGTFVPVAERSGLVVALGTWVLQEACRQAADWRRRHGDHVPRVQVNVSAAQLQDVGFPADVAACLRLHGLGPDALALEVTETMAMSDQAVVGETLTALHVLGVHLSLDDFGTGFSSLSRLADLPIDAVKVDRSFVSGSANAGRRAALVATMCDMARRLDLEVMAEGVETEAQRALLVAVGCHQLQGFLLARPVPADRIAETAFARATL